MVLSLYLGLMLPVILPTLIASITYRSLLCTFCLTRTKKNTNSHYELDDDDDEPRQTDGICINNNNTTTINNNINTESSGVPSISHTAAHGNDLNDNNVELVQHNDLQPEAKKSSSEQESLYDNNKKSEPHDQEPIPGPSVQSLANPNENRPSSTLPIDMRSSSDVTPRWDTNQYNTIGKLPNNQIVPKHSYDVISVREPLAKVMANRERAKLPQPQSIYSEPDGNRELPNHQYDLAQPKSIDVSQLQIAPNPSRYSPPQNMPSTSGMNGIAVYSIPNKKNSTSTNDPEYTEVDGERASCFYEEIAGSTTYTSGSATYDQIDERVNHYQSNNLDEQSMIPAARNDSAPPPPDFIRHLNIAPNPTRYTPSNSPMPSTSGINRDVIYSVPDKKNNTSSDPEYTEVDGERNSCFYEEIAGGSIAEPNYEVIRPAQGLSETSDIGD